nr:MAG TPA: hypothetical protein [Caudoviricetes sp.]
MVSLRWYLPCCHYCYCLVGIPDVQQLQQGSAKAVQRWLQIRC